MSKMEVWHHCDTIVNGCMMVAVQSLVLIDSLTTQNFQKGNVQDGSCDTIVNGCVCAVVAV